MTARSGSSGEACVPDVTSTRSSPRCTVSSTLLARLDVPQCTPQVVDRLDLLAFGLDDHVADLHDPVRRRAGLHEDDLGAGPVHLDLAAELAQGDRDRDELGARHVVEARLPALAVADSLGVDRALGEEVGALLNARKEPFEEIGAADADVDHVDVLLVLGLLAGNADERIGRPGLVGKDDVVVRRDEGQRQHTDHDHQQAGEDVREAAHHPAIVALPPRVGRQSGLSR